MAKKSRPGDGSHGRGSKKDRFGVRPETTGWLLRAIKSFTARSRRGR